MEWGRRTEGEEGAKGYEGEAREGNKGQEDSNAWVSVCIALWEV